MILKNISISSFFIGICFCMGVFFLTRSSILPTNSSNIFSRISNNPVIVLDAGHGGSDPGKVGVGGTKEKDINLMIALRVQKLLEAQDIQVIMTREEDTQLSTSGSNWKLADMKKRISIITETKPDAVISIHQNSYTSPSVYGAQCFYYTYSEEGKSLADFLQKQIISSTNQTKLRQIKNNHEYYLLKHSTPPTVIVECGFLSNSQEEQLLLTPEYQEKMAWAIHLGILQFLNQ